VVALYNIDLLAMVLNLKNMLISILVSLGLIALLEVVSFFILFKIYNRDIPKETLELGKFGNSNGLKKNITKIVWGKQFSTDSKGSRPSQSDRKKSKKVWIGDSVVEGLGVCDTSLFTYLMSIKDTNFDYLNFAHAGNTPLDYFNTINSLLDTNSILQNESIHSFHIGVCLNDIGEDKKCKTESTSFLQKANTFLQISNSYRLIKIAINRNSDGYFRYDAAQYKDESKVHTVIDYMVRISSLCKSRNLSCQFYLFPYRSQFVSHNFAPQQTLAYHMGINGLSFIDLSTELRKMKNSSNLYLFGDEIHFSDEGHAAIANILTPKTP
jgi:hypothetical protein